MKPILKLSCKKATELVEQQEFVKLGFFENLKLKIHLSICKACCSYHEQSKAIDYFFNQNSATSLAKEEQEEHILLKNNIINNLNNL
ncbi:MAG: hypothetical protein A3K10_01405 [Bacteroidetes bacterium RIFCSPLOWO2_12_FULL_31_6]|nr:MAG: hypothetical protein A3K10_01405 [Bacteroidetes bacterium RIFCSPLOWO2_12_FULL_31_6]